MMYKTIWNWQSDKLSYNQEKKGDNIQKQNHETLKKWFMYFEAWSPDSKIPDVCLRILEAEKIKSPT